MIDKKSSSIILALALALAGCSSGNERLATIELVSPPPQNYRETVVTRARSVYSDPKAIREAAISAPFAGHSTLGASSIICVRAMVRDEKTGAYTDRKITSFTFRNGEIVEVDSRFAPAYCRPAIYEPFPELEQEVTPAPPAAPHPPRRTKTTSTSR